ncbi:60S ribosomal protein L24 [Aspergillus udagawae]|uniref:60S ribosomal protein L24 n=1 Tax=Aspergillus udagawae TaxID=91492 RepID=A0ABQ1AWD7_9EURO|nr:60S ribosomal protein L24 [Aspergillus udagawae]GFF89293.1 60S ribosomal protein L24 [Aspergillus udagawae]GFG25409.1 60S ribosomal protein L24 [Aspergillus udagawae]
MSPDPHAGDRKALKQRSKKMNAERLKYQQTQSEYFPLTDSLIVPKSRVARALDACVSNLKNPGKQLKLRRSRSFESESRILPRDVTHPASDLPAVPNLKDLREKVRKQVESSSQLINKASISLPLLGSPRICKSAKLTVKQKDLERASPKESSFRRKFSRTMTGDSVKKASSMDRKSWQIQSSFAGSGGKTRSVRSVSVTATDKDQVEGDTAAPIEGGLEKLKISEGLKREGKPAAITTAQPKVVKCLRSPGDYVFLDLETPGKKSNANSDSSPCLSPKAKGTEGESAEDQSAEDESGDPANDQDPRGIFEKRLDAIHHIVKNIFQGQPDEDTKSGKASQDAKKWDTKNTKCIKCFGDCPVCGKACCIFDVARRTAAQADPTPEHAEAANQILKLIQSLGNSVLEASTYSLCTTPGGCGRYVCSDCWGICPVELCRDVQCKSHEQLAAATDSTLPPNANRQNLVSTGCASPTFKMRTYDDSFSGQKIYPGKGKLYVRGDSKIFRFQNGKSESLFLQRKNPRRIAWTVLYRRQHKKGISEEVAKKRTRRVVKHQRAIVGASLDVIKERRSMRPEARAAARQQAIKEAKEKKAASESRKKAEKAKTAATAAKGTAQRIQSKQGAKGSAPKVAAKSR